MTRIYLDMEQFGELVNDLRLYEVLETEDMNGIPLYIERVEEDDTHQLEAFNKYFNVNYYYPTKVCITITDGKNTLLWKSDGE